MSNLDYILDSPQLVDFSRLDKAVLDKIHDICSYASHSLPDKFEALMGYYMAWKQGFDGISGNKRIILRDFSLTIIEAISENEFTRSDLIDFLGIEEIRVRITVAKLLRSHLIECDEFGIYSVTKSGHIAIKHSYPENWSKQEIEEVYKAQKTIERTHKFLKINHDFLIKIMEYHNIDYKAAYKRMSDKDIDDLVQEYPIYKKAGALDLLAEKHGRSKKYLYSVYKRGLADAV